MRNETDDAITFDRNSLLFRADLSPLTADFYPHGLNIFFDDISQVFDQPLPDYKPSRATRILMGQEP